MIALHHSPGPPLSEFVELLWLYEGYALEHTLERLMPTGTVELVINLDADSNRIYDRWNTSRFESYRGPLVCGPHSEFFVIDNAQQSSIMGVHFKPGGAFPFLGLPAGELRNTHVALDTLWGSAADDLRTALLEADTPSEKFAVLERRLLAFARNRLDRHPAVAFALDAFQSVPQMRTVAEVNAQIGLSHRRFIEVFKDEVGMTPKLYCRVRRFQEALSRIHAGEAVEWTEIALHCGYFDQAHFIHDFREFSGFNPSTYLTLRGEHLNHVALPGSYE